MNRLLLAAATLLLLAPGCSDSCCLVDHRPIALPRGGDGELGVRLTRQGTPVAGIIDTGMPITLLHDPAAIARGDDPVTSISFHILGPPAGGAAGGPPRAVFNGIPAVRTTLGAVALDAAGGTGTLTSPTLVIGGNVLSAYSIEIGFRAPDITFWPRQPTTDSFLSASGFAVLHAGKAGGGEVGARAPHPYPASRLVLRACAAPGAFDRQAPLPPRCCTGDERNLATGADLSLVLGTGTGPIVLSRSAWKRIAARTGSPAGGSEVRPLHLAASANPINAEWLKLPRLALVDEGDSSAADLGACVNLGRARRLEQIDWLQQQNSAKAACVLPCDEDPRRAGKALDSPGYVEITTSLDVAVIDDTEPLLQGLRAEVRLNGPEVDGILGAAALKDLRVEIDYPSQPARVIVSCEEPTVPGGCRVVGRCPRLPARGQTHSCFGFGLGAHGLPDMCDNPPSTCP